MNATITTVREFIVLPDSEKKQYQAKAALDPIQYGNFTAIATSNQSITFWKDYLKLCVHPDFHCPHHPQLLREVVMDYSERIRKLFIKLTQGVSEALELDQNYVNQDLKLDSMVQIFVGNYYPRCPQPDQAIGIPPHTDSGLFTFLINNGVEGLQTEHDGKWFNVHSPPNSILVSVDDHLEIFTNGRFKALKHRVVVNKERERISIGVFHCPAWDAIVGPAEPLVEKDGSPFYHSVKYKEYLLSQLTKTRLGGKSVLEQQIIIQDN